MIINENANGLEECSAIAYDQNKIQREHMYNMQGAYPEETMPAENITIAKKEIKKVNQNAIKSALEDAIPLNTDPRVYAEFVYAGYKYTLAQWCYINAVDPNFILNLIDSGTPFEEAIFMRDNDATSPILFTEL